MTTDRGGGELEDDAQCADSIRGRIEGRLADDILKTLHQLSGGQTDLTQFRNRLVSILTRYERYVIAFTTTPKKERRRQLEQIEARALDVSEALRAASHDVRKALDNHGDEFEPEAWENWSFESGEPLPLKDPLVQRVQSAVAELIGATRAELSDLNQTKNEPRKVKQVALRQLIEDLAAFYASEAEGAEEIDRADGPRVHAGGRHGFLKGVLDWYDPRAYFSEDALKQQINRTLKAD
jgi:hypothetical protein